VNAKREPITDPIQWIKLAIDALNPDGPLRGDGYAIIAVAEQQRIAAMSDEELSKAIADGDTRRVTMEEAARRLAKPKPTVFPDFPGEHVVTTQPSRPGVPDGYHLTTGPGLPPEGIPCGCIHGEDHDERFFEVPPGGAPREVPTPPTDKE
jgi:hypothetical protein